MARDYIKGKKEVPVGGCAGAAPAAAGSTDSAE